MNESGVEAELTGAEAVRQWFGSWPSFHDAEVISLSLARKGQSVLRVYPYYPHKPATVDFIFENVTDIELQDFSGQNVIMYLSIETATDQNGDKVYRVVLGPCYGLAGRIDAKSLRVELSPGKSPDGVSQW
jgi:Immunity protein 50